MKKLILLGLLSIAAFTASASEADAFFDCCRRICCRWRNQCCDDFSMKLCLRPYNAFSPVCYGNITASGCCPVMMHNGGCGAGGCCPPPHMASCFAAPGYAGGMPGMVPMAMPAPTMMYGAPVPTMTPTPGYTPPAPTMVNPAAYYGYGMPYGYGYVQPVGYSQPNPYAGYAPAYYYGYGMGPWGTPQGVAPSYWYGN